MGGTNLELRRAFVVANVNQRRVSSNFDTFLFRYSSYSEIYHKAGRDAYFDDAKQNSLFIDDERKLPH